MEKPKWQEWDEFLISAWEKNQHMKYVVVQFLLDRDFYYEQIRNWDLDISFSMVGVDRRSPKVWFHLCYPVRVFFHQFFPKVNDLLWEGKKPEALLKMRCYRVGTAIQPHSSREMANLKKKFHSMDPSKGLPLIPGTNAINIRHARRENSDWGTVKPPARQRGGRL